MRHSDNRRRRVNERHFAFDKRSFLYVHRPHSHWLLLPVGGHGSLLARGQGQLLGVRIPVVPPSLESPPEHWRRVQLWYKIVKHFFHFWLATREAVLGIQHLLPHRGPLRR